ncbi:MAG: tetratricopeptide repeat protein [Pseudomonadota bacterium]
MMKVCLFVGLLSGAGAVLAQVQPVVLPELNNVPDSVRQIIEEARSNVEQTADTAGAAIQSQSWGQYGEVLQAHGLEASARQAYLNAHELDSGRLDWMYLLATVDISEGRLSEGVEWLDRVLAADSTDSPALIRRGQVNLELGQSARADEDFNRALLLDPDSAAALAGAGRVALEQGRFDDARQLLDRALELSPLANALYQPLGMALRGQGDADAARVALAQAGEVDPPFADPLIERVRERSRSPQFYLELALAQAESGELVGAQSLLATALSLAPNDALIIENYGDISARLGALTEARDAFQALVELRPEDPSVLFRLAQVNELGGALDEAEGLYREVMVLEPAFAGAREALAFVTLARRDFDNAASSFAQLAESASPNDAARLQYWRALAELGGGQCAVGAARLEGLHRGAQSNDPEVMAAIVRTRSTCAPSDEEGLAEAFSWAEAMYQQAPGMETAATLAMVYASQGQFEDAVDLQAQAMFEALKFGMLESRTDLSDDMARYRENQSATRPFDRVHPIFGALPTDG